MKTRDKIIHASVDLFNEKGERNITTNHIASHLGISPGNLYYHFRNKEDIIYAIYTEYADDLVRNFESLENINHPLDSILRYMDIVFQLVSKFRFFYSNLPVLLSKNPALKERYSEMQRAIKAKVSSMIKTLQQDGMLNIKDDEIEDVTSLIRITSTFWLSYLQTQQEETYIEDSNLYDGLLKIFSILSPYVTDLARAEFEKARQHYIFLEQQAQ